MRKRCGEPRLSARVVLMLSLLAALVSHVHAAERLAFSETFSAPKLDGRIWCITRKNDFQESVVDVVGKEAHARRLRMRAATIGTDDRSVKFHGVRTKEQVVDLAKPCTVRFRLDWNGQPNGCYLAAGLVLCPTATEANPQDEPDWLKVCYVGVPPGKNVRCLLASRTRKRLRHLYTEGWPRQQRIGRPVGVVDVELRFGPERAFSLRENGKLLYESDDHRLLWGKVHVYLQMSSHSNYPPREIFFDNVTVAASKWPQMERSGSRASRGSTCSQGLRTRCDPA